MDNPEKVLIKEIQLFGRGKFFECKDIVWLCVSYLLKSDLIQSTSPQYPRSVVVSAFYELLRSGTPEDIAIFYRNILKARSKFDISQSAVIKNIMYCPGENCGICSVENIYGVDKSIDKLFDKLNKIYDMKMFKYFMDESIHDFRGDGVYLFRDEFIAALYVLKKNLKAKSKKITHCGTIDFEKLMKSLIKWNHTKIIDMLPPEVFSLTSYNFGVIAFSENIDFVTKYLEAHDKIDFSQGIYYGENFIDSCCKYGYTNILILIFDKFPHEKKLFSMSHVKIAVQYGNIGIVKYFLENFAPKERSQILETLINGHDFLRNDEVSMVRYLFAEISKYEDIKIKYENLLCGTIKFRAIHVCIFLLENRSDNFSVDALLDFETLILKNKWVDIYPYLITSLFKKGHYGSKCNPVISIEKAAIILYGDDKKMIKFMASFGVYVEHKNNFVSHVLCFGDRNVAFYVLSFYKVLKGIHGRRGYNEYHNNIMQYMLKYREFLSNDMYIRAINFGDHLMVQRLLDLKVTLTMDIINIALSKKNLEIISIITTFMLENNFDHENKDESGDINDTYEKIIHLMSQRREYKMIVDLFCRQNINLFLVDKIVSDNVLIHKILTFQKALPDCVTKIIKEKWTSNPKIQLKLLKNQICI